jgi:hypothetical protein
MAVAYAGYRHGDPMALLQLRRGRDRPYEIYDRMRRDGTLLPTRQGNWVSTSYRVCNAVLRDRRFGVGNGLVEEPTLLALRRSMGQVNPPDHTRLRQTVQPAFRPGSISGYEPFVEATVSRLLDRAEAMGRFDLVPTLAEPLPVAVISNMMGISERDVSNEELNRYRAALVHLIDGVRSLRHMAQLRTADRALATMFTNLLAAQGHESGNDLLSRIVAAEGNQIKPDELLPLCTTLLTGGMEATINTVSSAVNALLDHPDQWDALCADPQTLAPRVVEETLRYDPPVHMTGRIALQPLELEDRQLRQHQVVVTLLAAANRDPEVFAHPNRFDIHREHTVEHLAFSSGIHYCLGQPLARLEATVALRCLAQRMPGLRRAGTTRRRDTTAIRGLTRLPVQAGPR